MHISGSEIQSIWQYEVREEFLSAFVTAYGSDGARVRLFRQCPGYIGTQLTRDIQNPERFLTIDYWQSASAFSDMQRIIGKEYAELDEQCQAYTRAETHVGIFTQQH